MAEAAICVAVTGRYGDIDGVWIDPVIAQLIMTLPVFTLETPDYDDEKRGTVGISPKRRWRPGM